MNKLQMAHEYAMKHVQEGFDINYDVLVVEAWKYADAMQAEADKRECKERTDVLLTKDKDGNCLHFHHEFGHKKCMDCGASLEEWQPDWSQAPNNALTWAINSDGYASWALYKDGHYFSTVQAPSFGYTGDWQDSLRKRPQ